MLDARASSRAPGPPVLLPSIGDAVKVVAVRVALRSAGRVRPVVAAAAAVATVLAVAGCAAPGPPVAVPTISSGTRQATSAPPSASAATSPAAVATVTIQNFLFAPENLTVAPGAMVTVVNQDSANHTVTAKDHSFDTGNIAGNAGGTFTAPTKPGAYAYICAIHPFMTGTLTVS